MRTWLRAAAKATSTAILLIGISACHYYKEALVTITADGTLTIDIRWAPDPDCVNFDPYLGGVISSSEVRAMCDLARTEVSQCARQSNGSRYGAAGITRTDTGEVDEEGNKIYDYDFDPYCDQRRVPRH